MNRYDLFFIGLLIAMVAVSLPVFLGPPLPLTILLLILYVVTLFAFSFAHGVQTFGRRLVSVLFGITILVTYLMEWLGTHFGFPFGHYYYTNRLGPLLLEVPVVIPIQWFNMLYVCCIMTSIILFRAFNLETGGDGTSAQSLKLVVPRILATSIVTGLFMVSWDFINDPYMVGVGTWVWTDPTEFFGLAFSDIPLSNFLGWVFTSALTVLLFDLYRHRYQGVLRWVGGSPSESANILVTVPYLYAFIFQAVNGIAAGVFTLDSLIGWAPILLAAVSMGLAACLTVLRYLRIRS